MTSSKSGSSIWGTALTGWFGALLGLSLLKFGNPIILDRMIEPPGNGLEFVFQPWPVRWGYLLLFGCVGLSFGAGRLHDRVPRWLVGLPSVWLAWQCMSAVYTIDARLTQPTLIHFLACVVCFYVALYGRLGEARLFWLPILAAFALILWTAFEQHYGGLEATRKMFYEQPNWQLYPPEYLKKIESNRIFSTLVYPNALAGALLLLLPAMLVVTWKSSHRFTHMSRAVLVGVLGYAGVACLVWSGSKSGWLIGLVQALVVLLRQKLPKVARIAIVGLLLAGGLVGFFVKFSSYFRRGAPSVSARMEYWKAAWRTATEHPIVGTGPGTFSVAYRKIKPPEAEMAQLTHNDYLEQASDSGWLGAAVYAGFICGSLCLLPLRRKIFDDPHRIAVWLGLLGWALQSAVEFLLYIPAFGWTAMALLGWLWSGPAQVDPQPDPSDITLK